MTLLHVEMRAEQGLSGIGDNRGCQLSLPVVEGLASALG
jgi:hypothetical protein